MAKITRSAPYGGILHEVVEHGGTLYLAGIVSEDLTLDIAGQAKDVMRQLETLLEANGSDLTRILQATVYLADLKEKAGFDAVWRASIGEAHMPARAGIGVGDLGPGVRVEMVVIAATA
ncbi:MAG: RidA family protein [Hyphomicrobiaceae bacterium]